MATVHPTGHAAAWTAIFWALWDNYTPAEKVSFMTDLIEEHSALVKLVSPDECPCCGRLR